MSRIQKINFAEKKLKKKYGECLLGVRLDLTEKTTRNFLASSAHTIFFHNCIIYVSMIENIFTDFEFAINLKSYFFLTLSTFVFPYSYSPVIAVTTLNFCSATSKEPPLSQEWKKKKLVNNINVISNVCSI